MSIPLFMKSIQRSKFDFKFIEYNESLHLYIIKLLQNMGVHDLCRLINRNDAEGMMLALISSHRRRIKDVEPYLLNRLRPDFHVFDVFYLFDIFLYIKGSPIMFIDNMEVILLHKS